MVDFPYFDARTEGWDSPELPRPIRSGLAVAAVGLLPLALGLADVIRPLTGLVFAGIFFAVGGVQWFLAHAELNRVRRRADLELLREPRPNLLSTFAQWRAHELTSDRHRLAIARAVTRTERDLSPALLPGASPLNRVAARPHAELFRRLSDRLSALDCPVTPQAVLQVEELLTSADSPLYARERASELPRSLLASLRALDGPPEWLAADQLPASSHKRGRVCRNGNRPIAGKTTRAAAATLGAAQKRLRWLAVPHRGSHR
jgi:hypothetical protein